MEKITSKIISKIFLMLLFALPILFPEAGHAEVTLPWSTTFNCSEWNNSQGPVNCDGLKDLFPGPCNDAYGSHYTMITTAANNPNNPNGAGTRGARIWVGDGVSIGSSTFRVSFLTPQTEVYVRWYMRYQQGFSWNPFIADKWLYFDNGTTYAVVPEYYGDTNVNIWAIASGDHGGSNYGWSNVMGGSSGDGKWHAYEVHLKMDTNGSNGVGEIWIDGIKRLSYNNINYGTNPNGWTYFNLEDNKNKPQNGQCMYIDLDDVAVSNTGPIGVFSGSTVPSAPTGLTVQ